jgi:ubiquinone/menaquinone biosynthesis C-methylase UbiE
MSGVTWESMADWYAAKLAAGSPIHKWTVNVILAEVDQDLDGQPLLDLGCGEGLVARALAQRGARVTGVDLSTGLIGHARRQEARRPLGIHYRVGGARTLSEFPDDGFAGVVANLSINDMPDLHAVFTAVGRVLRPGGWWVFTVPHPCFETPHAGWATTPDGRPARLVNAYFDEAFWRSANPQGVRRVGVWHRPLATYLNTLIGHRFTVARVVEPRPDTAVATLHPGRTEVPVLLLVRAVSHPATPTATPQRPARTQ